MTMAVSDLWKVPNRLHTEPRSGTSLKTIAPMINRPLSILQRAFPAVPRPHLTNTESK